MMGGSLDGTHVGVIRLDRSTRRLVAHGRPRSMVHSMPMGASVRVRRLCPPAPGKPFTVWVVPGRRPFQPAQPRGNEAHPAGESSCCAVQGATHSPPVDPVSLTAFGGGRQHCRPTKPSRKDFSFCSRGQIALRLRPPRRSERHCFPTPRTADGRRCRGSPGARCPAGVPFAAITVDWPEPCCTRARPAR